MKKLIVPSLMILMLFTGFTITRASHNNAAKEDTLTRSIQLKLRHLNELLGILSNRMEGNISEEQRKELAEIVKEISRSMDELADIIRSGKVTEEQLELLNKRLFDLRMRINGLFKPPASSG